MKVLIATTELQGARADDYFRTQSNELVFAGDCLDETDRVRAYFCECTRGFRGVSSGALCTTAVVADVAELTTREYQQAFLAGFIKQRCCVMCAVDAAHDARLLANRWPIGTVLERDRDVVRPRKC